MPNLKKYILSYEQYYNIVSTKNNKNNTEFIFENHTDNVDVFSKFENIPNINTGEIRYDTNYDIDDAEYEQKKVLVPFFQVSWNYADNTNPDVEFFDNIHDAIKYLYKIGDTSELDKYYEPYKEMTLCFKVKWLDRNNEEVEDDGIMNYEDWSYKNKDSDFVKKYGLNSLLDTKFFNSREKTSDELLNQVYLNLHTDIIKSYTYNDVGYTISTPSRGKYRHITVYFNDTEKTIILRISDHSYNPRNNDGMTDFISVEIANKNETVGRFHGIHGLQFDGDDTYDDVVESVNSKIIDIIESWNIKNK